MQRQIRELMTDEYMTERYKMFTETLGISLSLTIASDTYDIPAGAIKDVRLNLTSTGFNGKINFVMTTEKKESPFFIQFIKPTLIHCSLSISGVLNQPDPLPDPLQVQGIVMEKSVREAAFEGVRDSPVMYYDYEIDIRDAPRALWSQHYPIKLYTQKKMSDVIKDNSVSWDLPTMDWDELETVHDQICLALGHDQGHASFYDFVMWYTWSRGGVCYYDYGQQRLKFSGEKQNDMGTTTLDRHDIETYRLVIPETLRHHIRIHNSSTVIHNTIDLQQDEAVEGITHDRITRTDIAGDLTVLKQRQKKHLDLSSSEIHFNFKQFPPKTFVIGTIVEFSREKWFKSLSFNTKQFRVHGIFFHARMIQQITENGIKAAHAEFQVDMRAEMEEKDNPARIFPAFITPQYPLPVEGKIISEVGDEPDKTYQIYTSEETSLEYYHVKIPLWDLDIKTPFITDITTGHYFFPAFRDTRIVVDLFLHTAAINRFLDWGEGTRLPMDTQGNHILFGKNQVSQTSMRYLYEENKPVFSIKRTSQKDTELIQMSEESIVLQTKEE